MSYKDIENEEQREFKTSKLDLILRKGQGSLNKYEILTNETSIIVEVKRRFVTFYGKTSILIIVNEITEFIRAEQIKATNRSKDLILATSSHELKTPLNSINGMHVLLESHVKEEGRDYLAVAQSST